MRKNLAVVAFAALAACAAAPRIVGTADDTVVTIEEAAEALAGADVVALGELHSVESVHRTHWRLIEALHALRPDMVIAMEMFERDVQDDLLQYLGGVIDEGKFLETSRPWSAYAKNYRPVIEFARRNGIVVLAANAPRELARTASKHGVEEVLGSPYLARETTAPEDSYWDAFVDSMQGHEGLSGVNAIRLFYAAQCLKDDTMAETIVDHLRRYEGVRPLVVLVCGKMHSDYGRGTVQRIRERMPSLDVRVLSAELVADFDSETYSSLREIADYVIVAPEPLAPRQPPPILLPEKEEDKGADVAATGEGQPPGDAADPKTPPALGLMPDYNGEEKGVLVQMVRPGGPAETAGIREGDLIVALAGEAVADVQEYVDVLATLAVGQKVKVKVRRADGEHEYDVVLTARAR